MEPTLPRSWRQSFRAPEVTGKLPSGYIFSELKSKFEPLQNAINALGQLLGPSWSQSWCPTSANMPVSELFELLESTEARTVSCVMMTYNWYDWRVNSLGKYVAASYLGLTKISQGLRLIKMPCQPTAACGLAQPRPRQAHHFCYGLL